jgi:hypothetical protein
MNIQYPLSDIGLISSSLIATAAELRQKALSMSDQAEYTATIRKARKLECVVESLDLVPGRPVIIEIS